VKGWFRTDRDPTISATDLRRVAVAALEVAGALAYLHARGVLHGVSNGWVGSGFEVGGGVGWRAARFLHVCVCVSVHSLQR